MSKNPLSIAALGLPTFALAGVLAHAIGCPVDGLEVKDRAGNVRLKTEEGENGAFALVMLGVDGKPTISLSCTAAGGPRMVLYDASGQPGARVGQFKETGWLVSLAGTDSPDVGLSSAGKVGGLTIVSKDEPQRGIVMAVGSDGKPSMIIGVKDGNGDGIQVGCGSDKAVWCITAKSGNTTVGLQAAENGGQVVLKGGGPSGWITCDSKSADVGVGQKDGSPSAIRLFAEAQRRGVILEDQGRKTSGLLGHRDGGGVFWLGSQTEGVPNPENPGIYASWNKEAGAAMLLRQSKETPGVVLQDNDKLGSGLAVGDRTKGSARVGVKDAGGSLIVRSSAGDVVFEVPNSPKK